ncbi:hypothetical protein Micbo1qcDRAFT_225618 [Microdochium bolleyi]|uniref:Uncharacterized protein n=1 Tax=Microdochium bolleyi TaxID=196109 RepID=A0A136IJ91_9PEZI|nr:hypothetical protein Micbo1qcDRAFT_225618 [Microdochium bolleyi]
MERSARNEDGGSPFSIRILNHENEVNASIRNSSQLTPLPSFLPASYLTDSDDLAAPACDTTTTICLEKELNLRRLTAVHGWLWVAGRPAPPRPLHHQLLLSREILVTERMDMHLVWTTGRLFLKPIPRFLLEPCFWHQHLSQQGAQGLRQCALGFLFSYTALIRHESDFLIAKEKHLVPTESDWQGWKTLVKEAGTEHIYPDIDPRFYYGELRLSRLNKIYFWYQTPLRNYMAHWNQYGTFLQENFAWLASTTVYLVVALTAMQVGLATDALTGSSAFQSASYGFTVFSILGPLITTGLIMLAFCYLFCNNWVATVIYKKKRLQHIGEKRTSRRV